MKDLGPALLDTALDHFRDQNESPSDEGVDMNAEDMIDALSFCFGFLLSKCPHNDHAPMIFALLHRSQGSLIGFQLGEEKENES